MTLFQSHRRVFRLSTLGIMALLLVSGCGSPSTPSPSSTSPNATSLDSAANAGSVQLSAAPDGRLLKVATWNVEHLAEPIDTGCRPRTQAELSELQAYAQNIDADIVALQEVDSSQAVQLLFPPEDWVVYMSTRADNEPFECRGNGNPSSQLKVAYAVRNGIDVNSVNSIDALGLDMPGLRYGLEMNVDTPLGSITLLNVHMKSGCFVPDYNDANRESCDVFAQQAPILDGWIENQEALDQPYVVLGDFNHRLSKADNAFAQELADNSDGSGSTLFNTTQDLIGCHPFYPDPIDLIFVGGMPSTGLSYNAQAIDFDDMDPDKMLSDHCAVTLEIVGDDG